MSELEFFKNCDNLLSKDYKNLEFELAPEKNVVILTEVFCNTQCASFICSDCAKPG